MQTVIGDQRGDIGGVQHKKQGPKDGALRHPKLDVLLSLSILSNFFNFFLPSFFSRVYNNNNNNNNNNNSITMFMVLSSWQSHCESSPGLFDECRTSPSGRRRKTKPDDLGCESA